MIGMGHTADQNRQCIGGKNRGHGIIPAQELLVLVLYIREKCNAQPDCVTSFFLLAACRRPGCRLFGDFVAVAAPLWLPTDKMILEFL
jgi:hypothetical protein